MINQQLLQPQSIVVVGGSNDQSKPGGAIVRNILEGGFQGTLHVINPKEEVVQGIKVCHTADELPQVDLAVLVVAARFCEPYVEQLIKEKGVKAFIIITAGFGEETQEGAAVEKRIVDMCNQHGAALIGPNCIGVLNRCHHSVFTKPIPQLDAQGADFISGSGATAVFILEAAVQKGLRFNSVWSIGNGRQIGIEDVLEHLDLTFNETSSKVKLLYIEQVTNPQKLLKHASSLIRKGCRIAAIKSGSSESGSRAASSHTGALAGNDAAIDALFRKAGIVRCYSREELTTVGCILTLPQMQGKNCAIVTHAGGPGVMLTDALSKGGLEVPALSGAAAEELKRQLFDGAAVGNPIDILATGTPEQLGIAIEACDKKFDNIDAIFVIFGTPGLVTLYDAYEVLHQKMLTCKKPIYPILPSIHTAADEVAVFLGKGHVNFSDEVSCANALTRVMATPAPATVDEDTHDVDIDKLRQLINNVTTNGYVAPDIVGSILDCAHIARVPEVSTSDKSLLLQEAEKMGYPVVAKVVGPVHKSDVGGVQLNIQSTEELDKVFDRMMQIQDATAVMVQKMVSGKELFVGAKYEGAFGHLVLCGMGGIFIEALKDVANGLAPLSQHEAQKMIASLRCLPILKGIRGQKGIDLDAFAGIIVRLSILLHHAPEIKEMDINPLLADENGILAVDARIRIEK